MADETTPALSDEDAIQRADSELYALLGIKGLGAWAFGMKDRGYTDEDIVRAIRYGDIPGSDMAHQAYLKQFPMMDKFLENNVFPGDSPEVGYLNYRNTVRDAAARYGLDDYLVTDDKIAQYISTWTSPVELVSRMSTAAAAVATTPPETLTTLNQYYGINQKDLISYWLNPDETEAMLQQRYTAATLGGQALRQKFDISASEAENLAKQGVTTAEAATGFGQAAAQKSFMGGQGETATREDILGAAFGQQSAEEKIARIAGSRTGRFQEGGGFTQGQSGVAGLGTSATR
jgi:hypothetical protein